MLSMVRYSTWEGGGDAERSLVECASTGAVGEPLELSSRSGNRDRAYSAQSSSDSEEERPSSWLLRLGSHGCIARQREPKSRISRTERARHAILDWRLRRPYLIYCLACTVLMTWLLVWNLVKGVQHNWNLPQWKHHPWEEVLEVGIGVLIVSETVFTLCVLGPLAFFTSCYCIFDLVVAALTAVSVLYGLKHLGRHGEICEADVPLLMLRFVLQPARVLASLASTYRARQMQERVDELRVDFDSLPVFDDAGHGGGLDGLSVTSTAFLPMEEFG